MRPGIHLSWRLELWVWISMPETFCRAGRWSSSSAAGLALKLSHVCVYNIWIYMLSLHRPWGHTHKAPSIKFTASCHLSISRLLMPPFCVQSCILYPLPHSMRTMHSLRSQSRYCCIRYFWRVWSLYTHSLCTRWFMCWELREGEVKKWKNENMPMFQY